MTKKPRQPAVFAWEGSNQSHSSKILTMQRFFSTTIHESLALGAEKIAKAANSFSDALLTAVNQDVSKVSK